MANMDVSDRHTTSNDDLFGQIWASRRRLDYGSDKFERNLAFFVRTKTTRFPKNNLAGRNQVGTEHNRVAHSLLMHDLPSGTFEDVRSCEL